MELTATTMVAAYAAAVATISLVVAILAYRAAGPNVELQAFYGPTETHTSKNVLVLVARNSGRSESTIDIFAFSFLEGSGFGEVPDRQLGVPRKPRRTQRVEWRGPERPHRLKGDDHVEWQSDLDWVKWNLGRELTPDDDARVIVWVGTRRRTVKVRHRRLRTVFTAVRRPRANRGDELIDSEPHRSDD